MKKLLMILICGFAFTQSIQTKPVEVTITDWSDINLYELIENPIEGNYTFELIDGVYDGEVESWWSHIPLHFVESYFFDDMGYHLDYSGSIHFDRDFPGTFFICNRKAIINQANHSIEFVSPYLHQITEEIILKFWVTGLFEDEGVGAQGDLNNDDIIDVIDIVALVNLILGEE